MSTSIDSTAAAVPSYPAYGALDRVASIKGVPLMPGLMVFCGSLMLGLAGGLMLGVGGLLLALVGVPILLYFRFVCETDDQALRIVGLELMCLVDRRLAGWFGGTYTLAPIQYGRRRQAYRTELDALIHGESDAA
jgi:type IV secretion system protein VirB3